MNSSSGAYTAAATSGTAVVRVTDSLSQISDSTVTINSALAISPASVTLAVNNTQTFYATGGVSPYTYSILSGGGTINSSTGLFTAPVTAGTSVIKVQDTIANSITATITIVSTLTISPQTLKLPVFSTATFSAVLGTAPYSYSIFSGTGSVVAAAGVYTGGTVAGSDTVRVTDAGFNTSDAAVTLIEPVQIVSGSAHACVRYNEGSVKCWGLNSSGQLGQGDTTTRGSAANQMGDNLLAINLGAGRTAKEISAGLDHTCVILDTNNLKCFGRNNYGQLGYDSITTLGDTAGEMAALTAINFGTGIVASEISSAYYGSCVITTNKWIKCFGNAGSGYLLNTSTTLNLGDVIGEVGDGLPWVNH